MAKFPHSAGAQSMTGGSNQPSNQKDYEKFLKELVPGEGGRDYGGIGGNPGGGRGSIPGEIAIQQNQLTDPQGGMAERLGRLLSLAKQFPEARRAYEAEADPIQQLFNKTMGRQEWGLSKGPAQVPQGKSGSSIGGGNSSFSGKLQELLGASHRTGGGLQFDGQEEEDPYKAVRDQAIKRALEYMQKMGLTRATGTR